MIEAVVGGEPCVDVFDGEEGREGGRDRVTLREGEEQGRGGED